MHRRRGEPTGREFGERCSLSRHVRTSSWRKVSGYRASEEESSRLVGHRLRVQRAKHKQTNERASEQGNERARKPTLLSMHPPRYEGFLIVSLHVSVMHKYELAELRALRSLSNRVLSRSVITPNVLIIIHMDAPCPSAARRCPTPRVYADGQ